LIKQRIKYLRKSKITTMSKIKNRAIVKLAGSIGLKVSVLAGRTGKSPGYFHNKLKENNNMHGNAYTFTDAEYKVIKETLKEYRAELEEAIKQL
jgi:5-bromo-4-chloroindolyl phosphate hydrolysis protein